jgi:hypothetical protein
VPWQRSVPVHLPSRDSVHECLPGAADSRIGARRNFPDEVISEVPVSLGEERKERSSSRYIGVSWDKESSSQEGLCGCTTHRPSVGNTLAPSPPRRTQPVRMTMRLCKRTDQVPSATSRMRPSASRL